MLKVWLNKLERRIIDISGREHRAGFFSLETILVLISLAYQMVTFLRVGLYDLGLLKCHRLPCRVISFGNIVAGGSGKTPMVMHAASLLTSMGLGVVVITRGYGGTAGKNGAVAGDGTQSLLGPDDAGDEPCMMACRKLYPVIVDRDRVRGARRAMAKFCPHVILLDDAFQHLRIHRDLNIVLMDAKAPLGNGKVLPAGRLRESFHAVEKRADLVMYTRCSGGELPSEGSWNRGKPVFMTQHAPFLYRFIQQGQPLSTKEPSLAMLNGRAAVVFSAISDNGGFCRSVELCGVRVLDHLCFRDHHRFDAREIRDILHRAGALKASLIITTEKDYARLGFPENWSVDLAVMGVKIEFIEGEDRFKSLLLSCVDR
jgi:tetraacyldisaccharide 4'-kinase